ncbi:hypothetical protein EBAPG3_014095 [Nitrosospira lacus]|uniref:Uncharacterized protein n=1 Tax=Nitrosospira lacus TaxID=1288494 RepID=A0A1W6SSQ0_9PROT|nr:hypothetical protein [Nitrosospira lacus]ARO88809.1 hypothetical protein EBAPG3_014095 [Nitrosospira lacus]
MPDKTLRYLIVSVIVLLLIFQIGTLISDLFGMVWGALSAFAVVAVLFLSAYLTKTRRESSFWFFLPILLFTVVSIVLMGWNVMTEDVSWFERVVRLTPFIIGFGAPIVLLLVVYHELRKRTLDDQP